MAYTKHDDPKVAADVLLGHGKCHIIIETSEEFTRDEISAILERICGKVDLQLTVVKQDPKLAENQSEKIRCGDNGIFKGAPLTHEQNVLSALAHKIYELYPYDGKYILDGDKCIICQSHVSEEELRKYLPHAIINPLGDWTGGIDVDSGATNRKLGSDMANSVTGGGLHGKDLSKADVSANIYAFLLAQTLNEPVWFSCAIGDDNINGKPYEEIVEEARKYIKKVGGFEKFAEWGFF